MLILRLAAYLVLDAIKFGDAIQYLAGDRCRTGSRQLVKAPADIIRVRNAHTRTASSVHGKIREILARGESEFEGGWCLSMT